MPAGSVTVPPGPTREMPVGATSEAAWSKPSTSRSVCGYQEAVWAAGPIASCRLSASARSSAISPPVSGAEVGAAYSRYWKTPLPRISSPRMSVPLISCWWAAPPSPSTQAATMPVFGFRNPMYEASGAHTRCRSAFQTRSTSDGE